MMDDTAFTIWYLIVVMIFLIRWHPPEWIQTALLVLNIFLIALPLLATITIAIDTGLNGD